MKISPNFVKAAHVVVLAASTVFMSSAFAADESVGVRKKMMVIPEGIWNDKADRSYTKIINKAKKAHLLVIDPRLERLMQQMVPHAVAYRPSAAKWEWEIHAQMNGILNASGFPGGKILLNTGLYWNLELTDDELAFVIAHEMSHALLDHNREKVSSSLLLGSLPSYLTNGVSQTWLHEMEADILALVLMENAGLNPKAAETFFNKFERETERRRALNTDQPLMSTDFMKYRRQAIENALAS